MEQSVIAGMECYGWRWWAVAYQGHQQPWCSMCNVHQRRSMQVWAIPWGCNALGDSNQLGALLC